MSKSFDIALTNRGLGIYDSVRHDYIAKQSLKISKYSEASLFVFGFRFSTDVGLNQEKQWVVAVQGGSITSLDSAQTFKYT